MLDLIRTMACWLKYGEDNCTNILSNKIHRKLRSTTLLLTFQCKLYTFVSSAIIDLPISIHCNVLNKTIFNKNIQVILTFGFNFQIFAMSQRQSTSQLRENEILKCFDVRFSDGKKDECLVFFHFFHHRPIHMLFKLSLSLGLNPSVISD